MLILICHPLSSKKPADPPPFPLPFPTFPPNIANLTTININTCYLLARSFRIRSFHHETTGTLLLKDATGCIGPGPPGCKSRTSRPGRTGCTFIRGEGKDVCDNLTFKGKSQLQMHVYCIRCKRMKYLKINTEEHKTLRERERDREFVCRCHGATWYLTTSGRHKRANANIVLTSFMALTRQPMLACGIHKPPPCVDLSFARPTVNHG